MGETAAGHCEPCLLLYLDWRNADLVLCQVALNTGEVSHFVQLKLNGLPQLCLHLV